MMYRKNTKKSRTPAGGVAGSNAGVKIDLFIFIALIALTLGVIVFNIFSSGVGGIKRTGLIITGQWEALADADTLNELIREFEERNPRLRIQMAEQPKTQTPQIPPEKNPTASEELSPADIIIFDDSRLGELIRQDALYPLDSVTENQGGVERAIPLVLSMDLLFYNIGLLQAAGFDRPPKTRDEFVRYARAVSAGKSGVYGTALGLNPEDPLALKRDFFSWLWAAGVPLVQGGKPVFEGKAAVELVAFMGQLTEVSPGGESPFDKTGEQRLREFAEGRLAMIIAPVHAISFLREREAGFKFGVTAIPGAATPGKNSIGLSGFYAGIGGASSYPDEARIFLDFLVEKSPLLSAKIKTVPGSFSGHFLPAAGFSGDLLKDDPLYAKAWEVFESSDIAVTLSGFPRAVDLEKIAAGELRTFFAQGANPRDTAEAIQKQWEITD